MSTQTVPGIHPFDLVIFGGSGDLTMRKLLPSLYYHHCDGLLPDGGRIIGVARSAMTRSDFVSVATENARKNIVPEAFDETIWAEFAGRLDYLPLDASKAQDFQALHDKLAPHPERCKVYNLSTAPGLFAPICEPVPARTASSSPKAPSRRSTPSRYPAARRSGWTPRAAYRPGLPNRAAA
jgi:glucose-6-phosphate 1-dehydrogenase